MTLSRFTVFLTLTVLGVVLLTGCENSATKAQKLFSQGQYQQVIDKYPDTQFARRAEAMLAEQLLGEGKYSEVIEQFPNTPAAHTAKLAEAQALFDAGDYEAVIEGFPNTTLAEQSERVLSDSLYAAEAYDELLEKFPNSAKGKIVKDERAAELFEKAKKMRGQAKMNALQELTQKYRGTRVFKEAATMLRDLRQNMKR